MPKTFGIKKPASFHFWLLSAFFVLLFLTGGGSRIDVQSLVVLQPASVIVCAIALLTLRGEHFADRIWLSAGFAAIILLVLLHLTPLPPSLWQSMPGREIVAEVDRTVGLGDVWRPLTLTPMNGLHALLSLMTPLAVLLVGVQLSRNDLFRLLPVIIVLGAVSGLFGILQIASDPSGPLYLYKVTNNGAAVGLFANRNHAAVMLACMFPLLATFASTSVGTVDQQRLRQMVAASVAVILMPLVLVTGSRSGLLIALIGAVTAAQLYRKPKAGPTVRKSKYRFEVGTLPLVGGFTVTGLGIASIVFSRAEAFNRFFATTSIEDGRRDFWAAAIKLTVQYFPFGSGAGSFVEAYQIGEPNRLLSANYLNHAHNDWIETAMTFGVPGIFFMSAASIAIVVRIVSIWRQGDPDSRSVKFAKMAAALVVMLALASFVDYPVRTPAILGFTMLVAIWFVEWGRLESNGDARCSDIMVKH